MKSLGGALAAREINGPANLEILLAAARGASGDTLRFLRNTNPRCGRCTEIALQLVKSERGGSTAKLVSSDTLLVRLFIWRRVTLCK